MDEDSAFLGIIGIYALLIILAIICIPIFIGMGIAILAGMTGMAYFCSVIVISAFIWGILGLLVWI